MQKKMTSAPAKARAVARAARPVVKAKPVVAVKAAPARRPAPKREDEVFAKASAMMRSVPRVSAAPAKSGKGRMVRGSELLVMLSIGLMVAVTAAAFAAAGYYTSLSVAPADIIVGSPAAAEGAVQAAAEAAPAPSAAVPSSDRMPFLVVPGTLTDGVIRAPAGVELSMVGTAPGAQEVELVFVRAGDGSTGNEQVVGYGTVGSDGAFDLRTTFASGTVGRVMIKATADGETVGESDFKGIITE